MTQQRQSGAAERPRRSPDRERSLTETAQDFYENAKEYYERAKAAMEERLGIDEGGWEGIAGRVEEVRERWRMQEQREGTIQKVLGVLGVGSLGLFGIAKNIVEGRYSLRDLFASWRSAGIDGVRSYVSRREVAEGTPEPESTEPEPEPEAPEEVTEMAQTRSSDSEPEEPREAEPPEPATPAETAEEPTRPEENEIEEADEGAEQEAPGLEEDAEVREDTEELDETDEIPDEEQEKISNRRIEEITERFEYITKGVLEPYESAYEEILSQMNPEKIDEMTIREYIGFVSRSVGLHNAIVFEIKYLLEDRQEEINQIFKEIYENPQLKEAIEKSRGGTEVEMGPFLSLAYDESRESVFLRYAKSEELFRIYYAGVDRTVINQWVSEQWGVDAARSGLAQVGEMAAYMTPGLGTYLDSRDLRRHLGRKNWREAGWSGAFMTLGLICDIPIAVGAVASATGIGAVGGVPAMGVGAGGRAGLTALRGARVARGTGRIARAGETLIKNAGAAGRAIKSTYARISRIGRDHRWKFIGGTIGFGAGSAVAKYFEVTPSGRFYPGDAIEHETENDGMLPPLGFERLAFRRPQEQTEEYQERIIRHLREMTQWDHIRYDIISAEKIRIYRDDNNESTILNRNDAGSWEIEGLEMGYIYRDLYQAVTMANLLNNLKYYLEATSFTSEEEDPFTFGREGDLKYRTTLANDPVVLEASCAWTWFYTNQIGVNPGHIADVFNKWYKIRLRENPSK